MQQMRIGEIGISKYK